MADQDKALQEYLAQLDPEARMLMADADLGKDTEEFLNSQLGQVMLGLAHHEFVTALLALERTPWWRRRKIQELQNHAWRARTMMSWLRGLVVQGRASLQMMEEQEITND